MNALRFPSSLSTCIGMKYITSSKEALFKQLVNMEPGLHSTDPKHKLVFILLKGSTLIVFVFYILFERPNWFTKMDC